VFRGCAIFANQTTAAAPPRQAREDIESGLLDPAAEDAAAHHPAVDVQRLALRTRDHGSDDAVVAETVLQTQGERIAIGGLRDRLELGLRIADGREIELVAALKELIGARRRESV